LKASLLLCFAIGSYPFLIGTLANGQLAAIAVCFAGLAFRAERDGKPVVSGLALSVLAYKPTLLVLLIPMLLITRRWKTLAGFASGFAGLVLIATGFGGFAVWPAYLRFLRLFGRVASLSDRSGLPLAKFVDLGSCLQAALGGRQVVGTALLAVLTIGSIGMLAMLWWRSARAGKEAQTLAWATALTWTLLVNVYVPIYDAALAAIAVALALRAARDRGWVAAKEWVVLSGIVLAAASWYTSDIAEEHGIQILSVLLGVFGVFEMWMLSRAIVETTPPAAPGAA